MEIMEPYALGTISLLLFVVITLVQSALVGAGKAHADLTPGCEPEADYESSIYRLNRSHQNSVEIMPAAVFALLVSILVGVSSWWVNLLVGAFLLTRVIYIVIYARKIGKPTQGIRTVAFVAGWATLVVLCLMSIWALL